MLAIAAVVIGSLLPSQSLPSVDRGRQAAAFAVTRYFPRRGNCSHGGCRGIRRVLLVLLGIGLEYLQAQMGLGRMLDRNDALANTIGVLIGLTTAFTPLRDALLRFDRRL